MAGQSSTGNAPDDEEIDRNELYEHYPNLFSIRVHYGGVFTGSVPGRKYVNGKIKYVDCVDIDYFSVNVLDDLVEELRMNDGGMLFYHYVEPGNDLDFGLNALAGDVDVINLGKFVPKHQMINVYIEQGVSKVNTYGCSPYKPEVVIEEIVGPNQASGSQVSIGKSRFMLEWHEGSGSQVSQVTQVDKLPIRSRAKGKSILIDEPSSEDDIMDNDVTNGDDGDDGDDSNDSDFNPDGINDIEVDMRDFDRHVDITLEYMAPETHVQDDNSLNKEYIDVVETEEYDTEDEDDEGFGTVKNKVKKRNDIASNDAVDGEEIIKNLFYLGQKFSSSKEVKDLLLKHSVETRRELKMVKNDKQRVRAICMGFVPPKKTDKQSGPNLKNTNKKGENEGRGFLRLVVNK